MTAVPKSIEATQEMLSATGYVCGRALATVVFLSLKLAGPCFWRARPGSARRKLRKRWRALWAGD